MEDLDVKWYEDHPPSCIPWFAPYDGRSRDEGDFLRRLAEYYKESSVYYKESYTREIEKNDRSRREVIDLTNDEVVRAVHTVAAQLQTLATKFLQKLDEGEEAVKKLERDVDLVENEAKYKVGRRELNNLRCLARRKYRQDLSKCFKGIIYPSIREDRQKPVRMPPIVFTSFDKVGHGVEVQEDLFDGEVVSCGGIGRRASVQPRKSASISSMPSARSSQRTSSTGDLKSTSTEARARHTHRFSSTGDIKAPAIPPKSDSVRKSSLPSSRKSSTTDTASITEDVELYFELPMKKEEEKRELNVDEWEYEDDEDIYMNDMPVQTLEVVERRQRIDRWAPAEFLNKGVAAYHYEPNSEGEISLNKDDVVYVTLMDDSGWIYVVTKKGSGYVPLSFVNLSTTNPGNRFSHS